MEIRKDCYAAPPPRTLQDPGLCVKPLTREGLVSNLRLEPLSGYPLHPSESRPQTSRASLRGSVLETGEVSSGCLAGCARTLGATSLTSRSRSTSKSESLRPGGLTSTQRFRAARSAACRPSVRVVVMEVAWPGREEGDVNVDDRRDGGAERSRPASAQMVPSAGGGIRREDVTGQASERVARRWAHRTRTGRRWTGAQVVVVERTSSVARS
ncbi:uncharacterized protein B0H18DRAFT_164797 [Fomitopsis serialis]|uniref:uncharacterized protein n=1 Tax=Fomitopsis serialis TaxID=139415 RepID=UPI0020089640|nr:uncharacterized protein B0H18DRAFT_164797 [Neoantrodia serialis]KAH9913518.1 hypothetical protein B0H18DRAFT_164797 [Neoantrodia serialis]